MIKRDVLKKGEEAIGFLDELIKMIKLKEKLIDVIINKVDDTTAGIIKIEELNKYKTEFIQLKDKIQKKQIDFRKVLDSKSLQMTLKVIKNIEGVINTSKSNLLELDQRTFH